MTLIKTSLLNGIAVVIKMLTMLGLNKVLAIYVGPAGYAAIGNFQNAVQMISTFASGAINTGVVKYTAEYHGDEERQRQVWRTAGTITLIGSVITALLIVYLNHELADFFLNSEDYGGVFVWFAATLVFFVFNALLLSVLNGKKEINKYVTANITGSLFALIVTTLMTMLFGLYGALVALAIYQSLAFIITVILCCNSYWFRLSNFIGQVDKVIAINLAKYAAMALISAASVPVSHILIRTHIGNTLGYEAAGYWEAMWRLSGAYLMFFTTTLSLYYLPRLSELKESSEIKKEIIQGYKIILPVAALCSLIIYILRDFIVFILFTEDFINMRELFAWQMVGDTLKIGSWLLAYLMLSKAMMKLFIITQIVFSISFYFLTYVLIDIVGLEGVSMAHAFNYALYWIVMSFFIGRKYLNKKI